MKLQIREANKKDSQTLIDFIGYLADYEQLSHEMVGTKEDIIENLFEKQYAHALVLEVEKNVIGIAIYFFNFSTFYAKPTLYLEDLFILEKYRGVGYGTQVLEYLNQLALDKNCVRFEWSCLDWNEPSIKFYEKMGAKGMPEWIRFRLTEEAMKKL